MTPLQTRLIRQIQEEGPLSLDRYMQLCLTDPEDGYYTTKQAIGRQGDFVTAPEISQLFGEMLGIWLVDLWQKMACPRPFHLIEAGPGRGTLMADILRCFLKLVPDGKNFLHLHLIEKSPVLKKKQKEILASFNLPIKWHSAFFAPKKDSFILVANEFLDALPIKQFQFQEGRWHEKMIGLSETEELIIGLAPTRNNDALFEVLSTSKLPPPKEGDIFEVCAQARHFISTLCKTMKLTKSASIFIDYGHLKGAYGDTFQAITNHKFANPLTTAGEADLTAHVDFAPLIAIAKEKGIHNFATTQGDFLIKMGILERAGRLGASLSSQKQQEIRKDVERLAHEDHMGSLFKVMALTSNKVFPHGFS